MLCLLMGVVTRSWRRRILIMEMRWGWRARRGLRVFICMRRRRGVIMRGYARWSVSISGRTGSMWAMGRRDVPGSVRHIPIVVLRTVSGFPRLDMWMVA